MTAGSWRLTTALNVVGINAFSGSVNPPKTKDSVAQIQALLFGVTDNNVDQVIFLNRTLAASASDLLNLFDGSLPDITGTAAPMRHLKGVMAWIVSGGDASGVTVGDTGAIANPMPLFFGGTHPNQTIYPSGPPLLGGENITGVVVSNTVKNLNITNNGAVSVIYGLALAGTST